MPLRSVPDRTSYSDRVNFAAVSMEDSREDPALCSFRYTPIGLRTSIMFLVTSYQGSRDRAGLDIGQASKGDEQCDTKAVAVAPGE
jgi:hypothetical protein